MQMMTRFWAVSVGLAFSALALGCDEQSAAEEAWDEALVEYEVMLGNVKKEDNRDLPPDPIPIVDIRGEEEDPTPSSSLVGSCSLVHSNFDSQVVYLTNNEGDVVLSNVGPVLFSGFITHPPAADSEDFWNQVLFVVSDKFVELKDAEPTVVEVESTGLHLVTPAEKLTVAATLEGLCGF